MLMKVVTLSLQASRFHKNSRKLISLFINEVQDFAIFTINPKGVILSWNPGARHLFGYTEKEVIGQPLSVLFPNQWGRDGKEKLHYDLSIAVRRGQYEHETEVTKKNGERIWVSCIVTALWDNDKKLKGFTKIVEDITDKKELERRREEYVSVASHEIKTPLTSIIAYLQIIQSKLTKKHDAETLPLIGKTFAQIDKLTNLIGDLFDASKLAVGTLPFHDDIDIKVDDLVTSVVETIQPTFPNHSIHVKGSANSLVQCDKTRIEQVISNLLLNAIKYSPKGGEIIFELTNGDYEVIIAVKDEGIGIDKKDIPKIFERFRRLEDAKKIGPGLGLGLYLANAIVKHYKGHLWVASEKGKGSTFYFSLPVKK